MSFVSLRSRVRFAQVAFFLFVFKMGCASSKKIAPLTCPEGYDKTKFSQIMRLFDRLDRDGDFGVAKQELADIARLHVENRVRLVGEKKEAVNTAYKMTMERVRADGDAEMRRLDDEAARLRALNSSGQCDEFMNALKIDGGDKVDFWTFFDYMKTRTGDIKNIS